MSEPSEPDDAGLSDDIALMLLVREGDEEAFERLVVRHQYRVVGTIAKMLGGEAEAREHVGVDPARKDIAVLRGHAGVEERDRLPRAGQRSLAAAVKQQEPRVHRSKEAAQRHVGAGLVLRVLEPP